MFSEKYSEQKTSRNWRMQLRQSNRRCKYIPWYCSPPHFMKVLGRVFGGFCGWMRLDATSSYELNIYPTRKTILAIAPRKICGGLYSRNASSRIEGLLVIWSCHLLEITVLCREKLRLGHELQIFNTSPWTNELHSNPSSVSTTDIRISGRNHSYGGGLTQSAMELHTVSEVILTAAGRGTCVYTFAERDASFKPSCMRCSTGTSKPIYAS